jgi:hypothetical protein
MRYFEFGLAGSGMISRLSPLLLLCLVLFFAYKEKLVFKPSFCDHEIDLFAVLNGNHGERDNGLRWRVNL